MFRICIMVVVARPVILWDACEAQPGRGDVNLVKQE